MADKIEKVKKRKRQSDGSLKPSKRVAIEDDKQVRISLHAAEKWAPIIVSTPGVAIPTSTTLKPYTRSRKNAPTRHGTSGDIATTELLLHSSEHAKLDYTAREEAAGGADALLKHYVGVYDPETGKLELVEARKMIVRGVVRAHQATKADDVSTNMRALRNDLGQTFGTKKAKKAIASVTENAISPDKSLRQTANGKPAKLDAAAAAMLANVGEATKGMATRDELAQEADASKPRPKANTAATDVKDVYTIEGLIGLDTMKLIPVKQWLDAIKAKKEIIVSQRYVANRIQKVNGIVEKLKILRYMLLLLEFYSAGKPSRGGRQLPKRDELKSILQDMPEAVLEGVKRKFSDTGSMSKYQIDLLITHLCALALLVDNFEVDMWDLKEDLKLETKDMSKYFHEIGARIVALGEGERKRLGIERAAATQHKVAKLKLPLDFPKISFGRKR